MAGKGCTSSLSMAFLSPLCKFPYATRSRVHLLRNQTKFGAALVRHVVNTVHFDGWIYHDPERRVSSFMFMPP